MSVRLPIPGSDIGSWGQLLNSYLQVSFNSDGTLKNGAIGTLQIQPGAILASNIAENILTASKLATNNTPSPGSILSHNGSYLTWSTGSDLLVNSNLDNLHDVTIVAPNIGQVLKYDGTDWVNSVDSSTSQPMTIVTDSPYNADASGLLNSRPAIQQAIDDVSGSGGGIVFVPAGKYRIDYEADAGYIGQSGGLQLKDSVILQGEGFASMLFANGTWSTEAGVVGIGDALNTRAVRQAQIRDIFIKGSDSTANHVTPVQNRSGIIFNTASIVGEPDAAHRITNIWIWDTDRAIVFYGLDDQAIVANTIRIRWTRRQGLVIGHEDFSGGAGDNMLSNIDISSHNYGNLGYAGFEIYTGNTHATSCKAWFGKRGTAFSPGYAYKDGAGWYIGSNRFFGVNIEAQDNAGHGVICRYGNVSFAGLTLDSNSYYSNVTAPAVTNECSGLYIGSGVASLTVSGLNAFNRSPSHMDQKYGVYIESASRNINIHGTTKDNASIQNTPVLADQVTWSTSPHTTHIIAVGISAGANSGSVINGYNVATGIYDVHKASISQEAYVTGTTFATDAQFQVNTIGGNVRFQIEAYIIYRADAVQKAKFTIVPSVVAGSGTVECELQVSYQDQSDAAQVKSLFTNTSTSNFITANGMGHALGGSTIRTVRITGSGYVGTTVTTGKFELKAAEANGTSSPGVIMMAGSWLKIHLLT